MMPTLRSTRTVLVSAALGVISLLGVLAAAPAAADGAVQVSGIQLAAVPCDQGPQSTYTMTGDLTGCWYDDAATLIAAPGSGVVVLTGREHFVGCAAGRCGTLSFQYVFTGKFADPGNYLQEIRGHCEHLVIGASGGLAGTTGFIRFTDDIATATAPYQGHLAFA